MMTSRRAAAALSVQAAAPGYRNLSPLGILLMQISLQAALADALSESLARLFVSGPSDLRDGGLRMGENQGLGTRWVQPGAVEVNRVTAPSAKSMVGGAGA